MKTRPLFAGLCVTGIILTFFPAEMFPAGLDFAALIRVRPPRGITVPATSNVSSYGVTWTSSRTRLVRYQLQEATDQRFTANRRFAYRGRKASVTITGRADGTTYYYRVRAVRPGFLPSRWVAGANGCRVAIPPGPVTVFTATAAGEQVSLAWVNPTDSDFSGTRIQRRSDAFPSSPADGTTVYEGSDEKFTDIGPLSGTFYYAAFAHDTWANYSSSVRALASNSSGWVKVTDSAPWNTHYQPAVVAHAGKLWFLAFSSAETGAPTGEVWCSPDGLNWTRAAAGTPWAGMEGTLASCNGMLLVFAGSYVWSSPDGAAWTEVTRTSPKGYGGAVVVHEGKMWTFVSRSGLVWWSADGANWTQSTDTAPWSAGYIAGSWVRDGKIWVLGGDIYGYDPPALWASPDGTTWSVAATATDLMNRYLGPVVEYRDNLVVLGAARQEQDNHVSFSRDGVQWRGLSRTPVWSSRRDHAGAAFDSRIWVVGGISTDWSTEDTIVNNDIWFYAGPLDCEGSGAGNDPPTAELYAHPPAGPAPHMVVLEVDAQDPNCDTLTYSWDFGDGTTDSGMGGVLHTYEAEGTYTVTVTVSDGEFNASATTTVTVAPLPHADADIGPAGGSLAFGRCEVSVAADAGMPTAPFTLTEMPSMAARAGRVLDPARFLPIGTACRLETPLKSGARFTLKISYEAGEIPGGFSSGNLAVVVRAPAVPETPSGAVSQSGTEVLAAYNVMPATVDTVARTVSITVPCGGDFQIAALSSPLQTYAAAADFQADVPAPQIIVQDLPDDVVLYVAAVSMAWSTSYSYYSGKFVLPPGQMKIVISKNTKGYLGYVNVGDPWTIYLNCAMTDPTQIWKVLAHEFFHCIQEVNYNVTSDLYYLKENAWFFEGTADWACDEVFDSVVDHYHATRWERLGIPLDKPGLDGSTEYQTVGFWKWVEAHRAGTLQQVLANLAMQTHDWVGGVFLLENTAKVKYLDTFLSVWPDVEFLHYARDVVYEKDFQQDENRTGELWGDFPYLGRPKTILARGRDDELRIRRGEPGDSKENKKLMPFHLLQYLTIHTTYVESWDMAGTLHVKLPQMPADKPFDAHIVVLDHDHDGKVVTSTTYRDLSLAQEEFTGRFEPGYAAAVIVVDPRWRVDWQNNMNGEYIEVWIEDPCPPNPGTVTYVSDDEQLVNALKTVGPGNTIRLDSGTYYPPLAVWSFPGNSNQQSNLASNGVTLDGGSRDSVTINIQGGQIGLLTYGAVTVKNLTLQLWGGQAGIMGTQGDLTVCNTDIKAPGLMDGIWMSPWTGGLSTLNVVNSSITTVNGGNFDQYYGVYLDPCCCSAEGSVIIDAQIKETAIRGWSRGVMWRTNACDGNVTVGVDCTKISGNKVGNAVEYICPGCTAVEHCPP